MPSKIFYVSLGTEVLAISKIATEIGKFESLYDKITWNMMKKEVPKAESNNVFVKSDEIWSDTLYKAGPNSDLQKKVDSGNLEKWILC